MKRRKIILILAAMVVLAPAFADDGGSYRPEDWTYGNIYVKKPNDKIALERELLVVEQTDMSEYDQKTRKWKKVTGSEVTALFDFVNTTRENVVVPCAFPVVVKTQVAVEKDGTVSGYVPVWNGYRADEAVLVVAFGESDISGLTKERLLSLDKKLRTKSAEDYLGLLSRMGFSDSCLKPCAIEQDGNQVAVLTVGIETAVEKDEKATETVSVRNSHKGEEVYELTLTLHFYHELRFSPLSRSKLSVCYEIDSWKTSYRGETYELTYDISTGGTWKDAMKSFLVFTDGMMTAHGSRADFEWTDLGELSTRGAGFMLYAVENYKPQKGESLAFKAKTPYRDGPSDVWEREGRQDFVKNVHSSSAYKGSYKIAGDNKDINRVYRNADEYLRTSTYGAETSFDGIPYNGWVEGAAGDGVGEWIEFTLTKAALGPFASNGLARFAGRKHERYADSDFTVVTKAGGEAGATWQVNNRVRTMTLTSSALKETVTLRLADIFPADGNDFSPDWISLNAVQNPFILPKGTYRMTVGGVYKGAKYDDTALGEVWFFPLSPAAERILTADLSTDGFYATPLVRIVQAHAACYTAALENAQRREDAASEK